MTALLCSDTNLVIYCGRRLFVNPSFHFYIETGEDRIEKIDSSLMLMTTPVFCQQTVETLLDDLGLLVFKKVQPKYFYQKLAIYKLIDECEKRIDSIDRFIKTNAIKFDNEC